MDTSSTGMTKESLKMKSPFTRLFNDIVSNVDVTGDKSYAVNDLCSNEGFGIIRDVIHLYPLWAGALHHNVVRFAEKSTDLMSPIMPRSNAVIESRFR